jgi:hypothetical protein
MMRDVFGRALLVAAAIGAIAPAVSYQTAGAAPSGHSPSYQNGYAAEHEYYSKPQNHTFLKSEMQQGYTTALVCRVELDGGAPPADPTDWIRGCMDALHDLGFAP